MVCDLEFWLLMRTQRRRSPLLVATAVVASLASVVVWALPSAGIQRGSDCTIVGDRHRNHLRGTPGNDVICGMGGNDTIHARSGDDIVIGGPGTDQMWGGGGEDQLLGGQGVDSARGGAGMDRLLGQGGRDAFLEGDGGNDLLRGGAASDRCLTSRDGRGGDTVNGGPGLDGFDVDPGDRRRSVELPRPGCPTPGTPP